MNKLSNRYNSKCRLRKEIDIRNKRNIDDFVDIKKREKYMKNYIIKILDGDNNQVAQLGLKSDLTEQELRKSILWNQSSVVRFDDDRLDDIMTVKVEEVA